MSSPDKLFFGIGIQDIATKAYEITGVSTFVPHNGYQQLVVAWGIPGLLVMALFVYKLFKQAMRNKKIPALYYSPLVFLLVDILAGQFVTVPSKLLALVFIFEILSNAKSNAEGEKNG